MDRSIPDFTSPRIQVELMQELESVEGGEGVNLQFEEGDNPFSYYHRENHRDMSSSEDERSSHSNRSHENLPEIMYESPRVINPLGEEFPVVEVGVNESSKAAINLTNLGGRQPEVKVVANDKPVSIRLLKEVEVDLEAIEMNQKAKKSKETVPRRGSDGNITDLKEQLKTSPKSSLVDPVLQQKLSPKSSLNKTYSPKSGKPQPSSLQIEENRMLVKMGFEKKKANYSMLQDWDRRRAEALALHGRMIELLQNEVDLRIKSSLQNFEYYQTFFREKAKQEQKYVASPVINTRYALQNNSLSRNVYINCSIILNSLCDENTTRCKQIAGFVQLIRVNILKELTETHFNSSQKELLTIREKISSLKSTLKKYNLETEQRANELAGLFGDQSANVTARLDKDFYRTQISFLRKGQRQIEVQRQLGQHCLEYYHTAIRQQQKRSEVIREAMVTYSQGLKQVYRLSLDYEEMEQMGKHEQVKLIEEFYALEDMFDERTVELFKARIGRKGEADITLEQFTSYVKGFSFDHFDSRVLLLKQFPVRYVTLLKGKQTSEQPCSLLITVDHFLHLFLGSGRSGYSKPDITLKINRKTLEVKQLKEDLVDVVKKEEKRGSMMSYFWDSRVEKVYRIRFGKRDSREEFIDSVAKLMIDNY